MDEQFSYEGLYRLLEERRAKRRRAPTPPTCLKRAWTRF